MLTTNSRNYLGDHITNAEVLHRANQQLLRDLVSTHRLRLAGQVLHLHTTRPARQAMEWSPPDGKRKQGRPKKTCRSTFKEDFQQRGIIWKERLPPGHKIESVGRYSLSDAPLGTSGSNKRKKS